MTLPEPPEAHRTAWRRLVADYERVTAALEAALQREHRLSVSELRALAHLGTARGASCRLGELAGPAGVSPSALSRLVARLEHRGLVERAESPEDRRGRLACLTALGRTCLAQAQSTEAAVLAGALADAQITG